MKKAIITGISGQDGSYLADFLLERDYEVHGFVRRSSVANTKNIDHLLNNPDINGKKLFLHECDLSDGINIYYLIKSIQPDEVYNLAAQSHFQISFDIPVYTADIVALGALRILEAIKQVCPQAKYYQAGSSEMFGNAIESPQNENTIFRPRSPYAYSKVFAHHATYNYRQVHKIFACNGIAYNHESPRRSGTFVTKKITAGLYAISKQTQEKLFLGNLDSKRDWGYSRDYVEAMWLMLQYEEADDYIIATGEAHSVRDFVNEAGKQFGLDIEWQGSGLREKGIDKNSGRTIIEVDENFFRPADATLLLGNNSKAKNILKWEPKVKFDGLVKVMCDAEKILNN